jgi:hypothetical protein
MTPSFCFEQFGYIDGGAVMDRLRLGRVRLEEESNEFSLGSLKLSASHHNPLHSVS